MKTLPSTTLWRAWRDRSDERAFELLVRGELPYAADLARRCGASSAEAEDVVQDALARLARERSDVPLKVGIRAWICRRVLLAFKMHVRASGRRRAHERAAPRQQPAGDPTAPIELRDSVNQALELLRPDLRQAVVLRYLHDLDYREMAHVLGISRGACRLRVFKGLRLLRAELGGEASTLIGIVGVAPFVATVAPAALAKASAATAGGTATTAAALSGKAVTAIASTAVATAVGAVLLIKDPPPESVPEPPPVVAVAATPEPLPPPARTAPPPPPEPTWETPPVLARLTAHLAGSEDATEALWSFEAVDALIGPAQGEVLRVTDPTTPLNLRALAARTSRIEVGPGTFTISHDLSVDRRGVLEIVGAGLGKTVLRSTGPTAIHVRGDFAGLRVRDLTWEGNVFRVRGRAAGAFQRVRFRGWRHRAGFGAPLGFEEGTALLVFDACEFVGGYRCRPGGRAVAARSGGLLLFHRCIFADMEEALINGSPGHPHPRSLAHFSACTFDGTPLVRRSDRDPAVYPIRLRKCVIRFGLDRQERAARLDAFGVPRVKVEPDILLLQEPARCTLATLKAFLDRHAVPPGERVVALEVRSHYGAAQPLFVVHTEGAGKKRFARLFEFTLGQIRSLPQGAHELDTRVAMSPGIGATLRELLQEAWAKLDPSEPSGGIAIHSRGKDTAMLVLLDRELHRWR